MLAKHHLHHGRVDEALACLDNDKDLYVRPEEKDELLTGYKFKWNVKKNIKIPQTFVNTYKANEKIIDKNNFREFVII